VDDPDHATIRAAAAAGAGRVRLQHGVVILIVFVLVAFIGIPVFLSWKRNRG
jgi:hypothetical protein